MSQYEPLFVDTLETIWGEGFLTPGGIDAVDFMLASLNVAGKKILDIGCGIGGPACYVAKKYAATVTGVDVEKNLIEKAKITAEKLKLTDQVKFILIEPNKPLPFNANEFDIVMSKEAILHIKDKLGLYEDIYRVLKPSGIFCNFDWMHKSSHYSEDMQRFCEIDGLTFYFNTFDDVEQQLNLAGFINIKITDTTERTYKETQKDINALENELGDVFRQKFGADYLGDCLESWNLQAKVFKSGELRSGLIIASKQGK